MAVESPTLQLYSTHSSTFRQLANTIQYFETLHLFDPFEFRGAIVPNPPLFLLVQGLDPGRVYQNFAP